MKSEPVLTYGFLIALVNLAVVFGVPLTAEQLGALDTALIAFLSFHVRKRVTPLVSTNNPNLGSEKVTPVEGN